MSALCIINGDEQINQFKVIVLFSHTVEACEDGSFMTSKGFADFDGCGKAFVA